MRPDVALAGDKGEINISVRVGDELVEGLHVGFQLAVLRRFVGLNDGAAVAEEHAVILPLAKRQFACGLERYPLVAQRELVGGVGLKILRILPGEQFVKAECRPLLQRAVFLLGELAVGQGRIEDEEGEDER